jgi:hypothetical protein
MRLEPRFDQLAGATGYSKSKIIRKLLHGAILRLEAEAESKHDLVLALNRFSRRILGFVATAESACREHLASKCSPSVTD